MLSKKMSKLLNDQISAEYGAFYLYRSMQSYFHRVNLDGFASWMSAQSEEENGHASKLFGYVHERDGKVTLGALAAPKNEWKSPLNAVQDALAHEKKVTKLINTLYEAARAEKDHATEIFLQWFVTEQVEEEASVDRIVQRLKLVGSSPSGLLMVDREVGARAAG